MSLSLAATLEHTARPPSKHVDSAVDDDYLTGNIIGQVRHQKLDYLCAILRPPHPAQRNMRLNTGACLIAVAPTGDSARREDQARSNTVDVDSERSQFRRQVASVLMDSCF